VSNEEDVKRIMKWVRDNLGGADVLVNNAGVAPSFPLTSNNTFFSLFASHLIDQIEFQTEKLRAIYDTNVIGLALFTREVVQDMQSRGVDDGHIFHINRFLFLIIKMCFLTHTLYVLVCLVSMSSSIQEYTPTAPANMLFL